MSETRFYDCPDCGAGGVLPTPDLRCTNCGYALGEITVKGQRGAVPAGQPGESRDEGETGLLIKPVKLRHRTHISDGWTDVWKSKQGWTEHYVVHDTVIRIPQSGMKSCRNKVYCPTCGKDVSIIARSKESRQFYVRLLIVLYAIALLSLFAIGAGMLAVFGVIPGGIFFLHLLSSVETEIVIQDSTHQIHL